MHELSIALSIAEIVEEEALRRGGLRIVGVHVRIGAFSGVVKEALLFSYELACENGAAAGSRLIIEEIPGTILCPTCGERQVSGTEWYCCPECGAPAAGIVQGKELQIVSLEAEE